MAAGSLRSSQVRALVRLVNEAHELPEGQGQRPRHLLSGMCRLLGADAGACVLERDFRPEGRGGFTAVVLEGWDGAARPALEALQRMGSACNPAIRSLMELTPVPGAVVTALRRELVGDRAWYGAPYVEHYLRPSQLDDSVYSIRWSEVPGAVRGIGIYRGRSERPFDEADRELLHLFHAECGALLGVPEPAEEEALGVRLTPRERQTLRLLLQGLGDKQIAARLGISRFTVNQYTKTLYRRFDVRSRTALIARLLGGQGGGIRSGARRPAS
ncbi:response regulator transcription factor [Corallococcus exercitus]|uniref:Response regulator transcription factor n=1 Tax=Corallococcus exercitus TaxID=2316736 RepID=A0A7Y4NV91_9BACT|nr:LuxR C-terminal-related transcriptional regulator [Corallococcus exercitus]NOK37073.1 response regulator transcription factor [Corallococcus exercitus]